MNLMGEIFDRELCSYGSKNLIFFSGKTFTKTILQETNERNSLDT